MIELNHVSVCYDDFKVIENVCSQWNSDEMIMLIGANGAGKSTLLKSMMGFIDYQGELIFNKKEINQMNAAQKAGCFAYVAQQKPLPQHESVEEFLLMGIVHRLSLFAQPTKEDRKKAEEVLRMFHLTHMKDCYMDELSGGEVQMLYVARCFMEKHDMLILDEPCSYLDYHKQYTFLKKLKSLLQKRKMGAIITVHDPNLALLFADYMVCLEEHTIAFEGKIQCLNDKKMMAEGINRIYHNAFHILEEKDEIIMQWKSNETKGDEYA